MDEERFRQAARDAAKQSPPPWEAQEKRNEHMERMMRQHFEDTKIEPKKWYETWWGGLLLAVLSGVIVAFIVWGLDWI